jgi:hypothetical protein
VCAGLRLKPASLAVRVKGIGYIRAHGHVHRASAESRSARGN